MKFTRKYWLLILGAAALVYALWLGSHDGAQAAAAAGPEFKTNSDLDDLMGSATSGATSVTIAGEKVEF